MIKKSGAGKWRKKNEPVSFLFLMWFTLLLDYAYIMTTFGPFFAFIRLWIECMIVRPCSQAIVALTFSVYVLKPFFPDCQPPENPARLLAVCCICKKIIRFFLAIITKSRFFQWCWRSSTVIQSNGRRQFKTYSREWFIAFRRSTFSTCNKFNRYAKLIALFIIIAVGAYLLSQG